MSSFIVINEIEELLNDMNDGLTSTLSTISSNVNTIKTNVASILTNTNATTTENSSGVISAKLSYLINRRTKVITPSSTNIKTLSSSGSANFAKKGNPDKSIAAGSAYGSIYTCYAKYSGTYRAYFTASLTLSDDMKSMNLSGDYAGYSVGNTSSTGTVKGHVYVLQTGSASATEYNVSVCSGTANVSSTTKTLDFPAEAGNRIQMRISVSAPAINVGMSHYCGSTGNYYAYDGWTTNWTNISIRGTANEINEAIV